MPNIDVGIDFSRTAEGSNDDVAMAIITELALFSQKFISENINVGDFRCLSCNSDLAQTNFKCKKPFSLQISQVMRKI